MYLDICHSVFTAINEQADKDAAGCLSAEKQRLHVYACCLLSKGHTNNQLQSQQERVAFKAAMAVPGALGLDPTIANSGKLIYHSLLDVYSHLLETIPH